MFLLQILRGNWVVLKFLTSGNDARLTGLIPGFQEQTGTSNLCIQGVQKYGGRAAEG